MEKRFTKRFVWTDDSDYGEGFKPDWIPQADPAVGFGAAHDVFEHLIDTHGGFEGEMMAFGATHIVRQLKPFREGSVYAAQYYDFASFLRNVESTDQTCIAPPIEQKDWREDHTFSSEEMMIWVRRGVMEFVKESFYGPVDGNRANALRRLPREICQNMVGWINLGVNAAEDWYIKQCGLTGYDLLGMFDEVERLFNQHSKHGDHGDYLEFTVDLESCRVTANKGNEYDDADFMDGEEESEEDDQEAVTEGPESQNRNRE